MNFSPSGTGFQSPWHSQDCSRGSDGHFEGSKSTDYPPLPEALETSEVGEVGRKLVLFYKKYLFFFSNASETLVMSLSLLFDVADTV